MNTTACGTTRLCEKLLANEKKTASVISIGPAGELGLTGASGGLHGSGSGTTSGTSRSTRWPRCRHGIQGTQVGARGSRQGQDAPGPGFEAFNALTKRYSKDYLDGPQMMKHGTSSVVPLANMLNTFVYKNRTEGQSPDVEALDGARILESFETRGGGMHNCMTGCIVKCSNVVHDADGNYKTSALEFETLTLLGASCAIKTFDEVADLESPLRRSRP